MNLLHRPAAAFTRALPIVLALTVLSGQIVDKTTGQPLAGVDVSVAGNTKIAPARSNETGRYTLRGLSHGRVTLSVSSDDVPPQTFAVVIGGGPTQHFTITACSTTLDYSCAAALP
jgi:hypothetical protein